mgnify:CR=1 FL=1
MKPTCLRETQTPMKIIFKHVWFYQIFKIKFIY